MTFLRKTKQNAVHSAAESEINAREARRCSFTFYLHVHFLSPLELSSRSKRHSENGASSRIVAMTRFLSPSKSRPNPQKARRDTVSLGRIDGNDMHGWKEQHLERETNGLPQTLVWARTRSA
jgi:hypothetical protein